jgi:hypothetical protein
MTPFTPYSSEIVNPYEQDYFLWLEKTIDLLREKRFNEVDLENLLEELENMGRNEKKALQSNLTILLMHLLKYKYQSQKRSKSWLSTIVEHRRRLIIQLEDTPSLKRYFLDIFDKCYQDACLDATTETGLSQETFSKTSPFTVEEILNPSYLPPDSF